MDLRELSERSGEINRHPWELARLEVVKNKIKSIAKDGNVFLDLGCGDTFFIEKIAETYPNSICIAVDIAFDDNMIEDLRVKYRETNIKVFKTLEHAFNDSNRRIDTVFLLDVVEHIEKDQEFLQDLISHEKITNDTNIIITVPAFQSLFTSHDKFLGHYRRYSNATLRKLMDDTGIEIISMGYFFTSLLGIRALQYLKEKYISKPKETTGLVEWKGSKSKSSLLKGILLIDYKITSFLSGLGIKTPGLSNFLIGKIKN